MLGVLQQQQLSEQVSVEAVTGSVAFRLRELAGVLQLGPAQEPTFELVLYRQC